MTRTELPPGKWQDIAADFMGPLPSGHYLLVVVDYYSRYYETKFMRKITTEKLIDALEDIFTIHGLPVTFTSDNGPQLTSDEFEEYLEYKGIEHRKVTPEWAEANGEVERQNLSQVLKDHPVRKEEPEEGAEKVPVFIQNNSTRHNRSLSSRITVWKEDQN